jgi:hypothetical protein
MENWDIPEGHGGFNGSMIEPTGGVPGMYDDNGI